MSDLEKDQELVRALVAYAGTNVAEVAKRARIAPSTLQRPASGTATTRLSQTTVGKLQSAFPDFTGWVGESTERAAGGKSDTLPVQMLDFAYGMGGTYLDDALQEATTEYFPVAFLRNYTRAPADQLYFAKGIGDSMMPTIHDSDLVLIDRSQDTPRMDDKIWAVAKGEIGMIKRLRFSGEQVIVMSDNQSVSDYAASDDELRIIGRVVGVFKGI